ncbi:tandem-95 repeat protein [Planctomycetota bacterium]
MKTKYRFEPRLESLEYRRMLTPVLFEGTGHYYDFVPGAFSWDQAIAHARSQEHMGLPGHLATLSTEEEDSFIRATFPEQTDDSGGPWIGASWSGNGRGPTEGYSWITGEEFSFTGWNDREPTQGRENALHFSRGGWNDVEGHRTDLSGYFIEHESLQTDYIGRDIDLTVRGIDFSYWLTGAPAAQDTYASIYWASSDTVDSILGQAAAPVDIPASTPLGATVTVNVSANLFESRIPGATHLLVVLDAPQLIDEGPNEANNILAIQLSGVAIQSAYSFPPGVEFSRPAPGVLANYFIAGGEQLSATLLTAPENGTLSLESNGAFRYVPNEGFLGVDSFHYEVTDGEGASNTATTQLRVGDYSSAILADNPIGYWRLNEPSDNYPAYDSSGNSFHGDYADVDVGEPGGLPSEFTTAAMFEHDNARIELGRYSELLALQNDFAVEAWIKPTRLSGSRRIFSNTESNARPGFGFGVHNDSLLFTTFDIRDYVTHPVLEPGNWYHVAVNFDSFNNATFFVNGEMFETVVGNAPPRLSNSAAYIGGLSHRENFQGTISEVAVYDQLLSSESFLRRYEMGMVDSGKVPVATSDLYRVQGGATFEVSVPTISAPRYSFNTDFSEPMLDPNLADPSDSFFIQDGILRLTEERQYVGTQKSDYLFGDFVLEVDVDMRTTERTIEFVGIGPGTRRGNNEPEGALFLRLHSVGHNGRIDIAAEGEFGEVPFGVISRPGIHRVRLTKTGNQLLAEVDAYRDGVFKADMSYFVDNIQRIAPFLNDANSRLFLGGSTESSFDNLSIVSSLDESSIAGVVQNDIWEFGLQPTTILSSSPENGELVLNPDGTFLYTPDPDFIGGDSFAYFLDDGRNWSNLSEVALHVNGAPVARSDRYTLVEETDLLVGGPVITIAETGFNDQAGIHGNDALNSPYRLNADVSNQGTSESDWANGWDEGGNSVRVVSVPVLEGDGALHIETRSRALRAWNDAQDDPFTVDQHLRFTDESETVIHLFDGEERCCSEHAGPGFGVFPDRSIQVLQDDTWIETGQTWEPDQWHQFSSKVDMRSRTWELLIDGVQVLSDTTLSFVGNPSRIDSINYETGRTGDGVFVDRIRVTGGNDALGVLSNDFDLNGDSIAATLVETTQHGSLTFKADGTFRYEPDSDFSGTDSFSYRAVDQFGQSELTTVELTVEPVNDSPIAADDEYVLGLDRQLNASTAKGVLSNDSDIDGDALTAVLVTLPLHGQLVLNSDGSFSYEATVAATVDQFTYVATDGDLSSAPRTVTISSNPPTITVGEVNLRPNLPGQHVPIFVSGGHLVSGIDFFAIVGDGGPERTSLGLEAGRDGPAITSVDLKTGTIFSSVPDVARDLGSLPQIANWTLSLADGGSVAADGLLATITVDTTGFLDGTWDFQLDNVLPSHPSGPFASTFADWTINVENGSLNVEPAAVVARNIFYNNSSWDGRAAAANADDDLALATDKSPLLPGGTGGFVNYTSYSRGINGVMVDIANHPSANDIALSNFEFRVGRNDDVSNWQTAPTPEMLIRSGHAGSDNARITFTWPDNAIQQTWLQVRMKSNANTLLASDDVFYFGNAIGETGNSVTESLVTSVDVIGTRDHQRGPFDAASIADVYDFDRDKIVSSVDVILARDHQVGFLTALPLIEPQPSAMRLAAVAASNNHVNPLACSGTSRLNDHDVESPIIHKSPNDSRRIPGDSNLDGEFNSQDLVLVLQVGEYEDDIVGNSSWAEGDWDCSGDFDSEDLILAFQHYGIEQSPIAHSASEFMPQFTADASVEAPNQDPQDGSNVLPFFSNAAPKLRNSRAADLDRLRAIDSIFQSLESPLLGERRGDAFVS